MWSPDEKRLAVAASRDDGPDSMVVLDVDGNAPPRYFGPTRANSPLPADCAIAHRLSRLIWKILHQGVAYEERGPAVAKHRAQRRAAKMIRELRNLGYRVELVPARSVSRV